MTMEEHPTGSHGYGSHLAPEEQARLHVELWKKTVDVQQHFNDIEIRIRNLAISLLVAVVGGASLAITQGSLLLAVGILVAGLIGWGTFFLMDYLWYHRLLKGAVDEGLALEEELKKWLAITGLTHRILEASPFKMPDKRWALCLRGKTFHSKQKMKGFYGSIAILFIVGILLLISIELVS
jgi:hypothetical protein